MNIEKITGSDAIEKAMKCVESFLKDPDQRVFQILGYFGIGKRTALQELFKQKGIEPVIYNLTNIDTAKYFEKRITKSPDSIHLWDDVFRSNIMNKNVSNFFKDLANNKIGFKGKFILVANEKEFSENNFPDLPGVHISMGLEDTIAHVVNVQKSHGLPEYSIRNSIQIIVKSFNESS